MMPKIRPPKLFPMLLMKPVWVTLLLLIIVTCSKFCSLFSMVSKHVAPTQNTTANASAILLRDAKLSMFAASARRPVAPDERPFESDTRECVMKLIGRPHASLKEREKGVGGGTLARLLPAAAYTEGDEAGGTSTFMCIGT